MFQIIVLIFVAAMVAISVFLIFWWTENQLRFLRCLPSISSQFKTKLGKQTNESLVKNILSIRYLSLTVVFVALIVIVLLIYGGYRLNEANIKCQGQNDSLKMHVVKYNAKIDSLTYKLKTSNTFLNYFYNGLVGECVLQKQIDSLQFVIQKQGRVIYKLKCKK